MIKMSAKGKGQSENQITKEEELRKLFLGIMEGYNDSAIPPLSYFSTPEIPNTEEKSSNSNKMHKNESERMQDAKTERRRRDQMRENFSLLQSMVPSLLKAFKPSKEKILCDTVNYIKYLEEEAERLEVLKKSQRKEQNVERPILSKCTNHSSVNITISDSATFLVIQLPFRRGSVLDILKILQKHQAEVMEARIDVGDEKVMTFTATVRLASDGASSIDKMSLEPHSSSVFSSTAFFIALTNSWLLKFPFSSLTTSTATPASIINLALFLNNQAPLSYHVPEYLWQRLI